MISSRLAPLLISVSMTLGLASPRVLVPVMNAKVMGVTNAAVEA